MDLEFSSLKMLWLPKFLRSEHFMKKYLALVLVLSFLLRLVLAFQPIDVLVQKIILDDSFYGFETARNVAHGFLSHNGYEPTNGVQPLWPLMVSQFFNFGDGVRLVLFASALIDTLAVFLIYKIARKFLPEKISILAAAFYGLNPVVAFTAISGIDVVLAIFMAAVIFYSYISEKNPIILGIIMGLGLLTRADFIFLAAPILASLFLKNKKSAAIVFSVAAIIFAPWLILSFVNFGTLQQSSGVANYEFAHGILQEPRPEYSAVNWLARGAENSVKFFSFLMHYFGAANYSVLSYIFGAAALLVSSFGFFKERKNLAIPAMYGFLIIIFYSFYLWSFGPRYIAPFAIFFAIALAAGIGYVSKRISSPNFLPAAAMIFIIIFSYSGLQVWEKGYFPWQAAHLDAASWIKENTNETDVIGSFNSGIITFYSGRKVVNLDGIMNFKAIEAIKNRNVYNYMKSENVSYWVDMDFFPPEAFENQETFDISKDNRWKNVLGNGSENLKLLEQKFYTFKNLRGNNITIVRFVFEVN